MHTYRCLIVPDADVALARKVWALDPEYSNEFRIPLAPAGAAAPTHWMSAGPVTVEAARLLPLKAWDDEGDEIYDPGHPDEVAQRCRDDGLEVTDQEIQALWLAANVTEQSVSVALDRLGLEYWQEPVAPDADS